MNDPRDDGFNYGRGWGSDPKPPTYLFGMAMARRMGQALILQSKRLWRLEMALRNVRVASTGAEKATAVAALRTLIDELTHAKSEVVKDTVQS
jgi:hypothetical protein